LIRSLSPKDPRVLREIHGEPLAAGLAYHQGTVWSWLIGPYCDAYAKVNGTGRGQRKEIAKIIQPLLDPHGAGGGSDTSRRFSTATRRSTRLFALRSGWSVGGIAAVYDTHVR